MKTHRACQGAALAALIAVVAALTAVATAGPQRRNALPTNTAIPKVEGNADVPFVGDKLTANNGNWSGNPTSITHQWDRCDPTGDRQNCVAITGATANTYLVQKADVGHTLRVRVTARNADGATTKDSKGTGIVSDTAAPKSYSNVTVSGDPIVGSTLTASTGAWAGATSLAYQWEQCDASGNNCIPIAGATGATYGVRSGDVGHELRVQITATNKYGASHATSNLTKPATSGGATTTTTTTAPGGGGCAVSTLKPPQRLLIDRWNFEPGVITRGTGSFIARIHVIEANGRCSISGALLWSTAIPYNQTNVVRAVTAPDGWATLTYQIKFGFPANPGRQQILALLVRATKPGDSLLAGVSTRRVLAQRVNLH